MASPILLYQPGGGVSIITPLPPPLGHVAGENGIAFLTKDQSYVEVVFPVAQPRSDWTFVECRVLNTTDLNPLNIWPGIITHKSRTGFTLQLNGIPDTGNYYLDWAINGATVGTAGVATSYLFSGPANGPINAPSTFVVALPAGTILDDPITITPDDGGAGGTFSPIILELSTGAPTAYFTYTPVSYGTKIISVSDDAGMADPAMLNFTVVAASYTLTGPSSGGVGVASTNFTVALPPGSVAVSAIIVTPNDSGGGGTFTPTNMTLTTAAPSATFIYTPASAGTKTISTTNNRGLTDPTNLSYAVTAPTYSLSGPSSGSVGLASTNFTVTLAVTPAISGTVVVTPTDTGGGGTFTPTTVSVTTAAPTATFTYTAASAGAKTISVTNNRGLINPANLTYAASIPPIADGDPVGLWVDSSGNGHDATQTGSARPIYKTAIVGGKPVVRFASASSQCLTLASAISGATAYSCFVVMKPATGSTLYALGGSSGTTNHGIYTLSETSGDILAFRSRSHVRYLTPNPHDGAFHVFTTIFAAPGVDSAGGGVDGTALTVTAFADIGTGDWDRIGTIEGFPVFSDGDIAEILFFNVALVSPHIENMEKTLGLKYGITVVGGVLADPLTVPGLVAWWKADAL